jgi:outer membrane protein assembly factor BamD
MEDKGYIMADYYLDEYLRKYATGKKVEYIKFLKLKASFLGLKDTNRDQKLILNTLEDANKFLSKYPKSIYKPLVNTIKVRLKMAEYLLMKILQAFIVELEKIKLQRYIEKKIETLH